MLKPTTAMALLLGAIWSCGASAQEASPAKAPVPAAASTAATTATEPTANAAMPTVSDEAAAPAAGGGSGATSAASASDAASTLAAPGAAKLEVVYSTSLHHGLSLKETPKEVQIVSRDHTHRIVGAQLALNAVLTISGGGPRLGFATFAKGDLAGSDLPALEDRRHVHNPVPTDFVRMLKTAIGAKLVEHDSLRDRSFKHPVVVGGGSARLMYETLTGEADRYFLQLDLTVYKRKESIGLLAWNPDVRVDCSGRSERTAVLEEWAADNYLPVQAQLQQQLKACEQKVLAELPNLLAN